MKYLLILFCFNSSGYGLEPLGSKGTLQYKKESLLKQAEDYYDRTGETVVEEPTSNVKVIIKDKYRNHLVPTVPVYFDTFIY